MGNVKSAPGVKGRHVVGLERRTLGRVMSRQYVGGATIRQVAAAHKHPITPQPPPGDWPKLTAGDKVKFDEQRQRFTVRAVSADGRYAICTKPFNARRTVLYCIVDFYNGWRGPDNLVFSFGYETPEEIAENMRRLGVGDMEVSHRRYLPLHLESIKAPLWEDKRRWRREHEAAMAARGSSS